MLKAFLDRYGSNGLAGTVAVPVMTGGWPRHLLAVQVHRRPALAELCATVPARRPHLATPLAARGLYVTDPESTALGAPLAPWAKPAVPRTPRALNPG